jgi:hypothetical protein
VSVEKVVATMEVPINHHGADRPEAKNSAVPVLARRAKKTAGATAAARHRAMTIQSIEMSCTKSPFCCQNLTAEVACIVRLRENELP